MTGLEQVANVKEYFLKFLPGQKVSNLLQDRIVEHLTSPLTEPCIAFMVFVSEDFEKSL